MRRQIYLEPVLKYHAFAHQLQTHPPDGYEVVLPKTVQQSMYNIGYALEFGRYLLQLTDVFLPTGIVKAYVNRFNYGPPDSIVYATDQLVLRSEDWVVEVEYASLLLGSSPKHLVRYKEYLQKLLSSRYCKKIRCWTKVGAESLAEDMDASGFAHKIVNIPVAIAPKSFVKEYRDNQKVRLLFVGSGTSKGGFDYRGGRESLEAFVAVRKTNPNLEMVVRSDVPAELRRAYANVEGLVFWEQLLSDAEMEQLFLSADIFMIPSHNTSPMIVLDAMRHELPTITIDSWANAEYVEDGQTGLVAPKSKNLPYFYRDTHQPNFSASEFVNALKRPDGDVVHALAKRLDALVQSPELRRRMGRAAREAADNGVFSLAKMNAALAKMFDEARAERNINSRT